MDQDKTDIQAPTQGQTPSDDAPQAEQVFDVSPDLTMSPVHDEAPPAPAIVLPDLVAPVTPRPQPLQNISSPMMPAKTVPANPPTKIVDASGRDVTEADPGEGLQHYANRELGSAVKPAVTPSPAQNDRGTLKNIRTYESDVAEIMSRTHVSTASIAIAESVKTQGEPVLAEAPEKPSHIIRNLFFALLSLILLAAGAGGAYYLYSMSPLAGTSSTAPAPTQRAVQSIVPSDSFVVVPIDGLNQQAIIARVQQEIGKPLAPDSIKEIIFAETSNGVQVRVTANEMLQNMGLEAPDMIARSLAPSWMLGVYSDDTGMTSPFVVTTNTFFQNAFAGMLSWEPTMASDLKPYLPVPVIASSTPIATSTAIATSTPKTASSTSKAITTAKKAATSSPTTATSSSFIATLPFVASVASPVRIGGRFQDRIVKNKDVREYVTSNGALFLYSFIDNNRMVVAANEAALSEVVTRLEKQAFVR